ncbi:protein-tyrosine phosphatase family protein [Streptomyces purpureus]|uniref:Protein-tyrosine-phosphatase n=1 Tax=Streptomyces purpureus TaxID=1951 RepID=A0A918H2Y1_9ACTN|nr:hypothetical protein [Streptomyces purpureus]GGT34862.1 protein-tyrosine-phosphatase [Streptomyces purpureus]
MTSDTWDPTTPGILPLPSGRLIRGRGLREPLPPGPHPDYAVYLLGKRPPQVDWEAVWIHWPDFWVPTNRTTARAVLGEAWDRAATERVEVACFGGRGRTGTALACLAVIDGVPPTGAVQYVRDNYDVKSVETPWQRRYVRHFKP